MLVELPYTHLPHYTGAIFYKMQLMNYIPIIAHPERNAEIKRKPNLLVDLVQKGALAQVTAASVSGMFGKESQKFSIKLIKHHLIHFIASDAHNTTNRSFQLKSAYNHIESYFSKDYLEYFKKNSVHVVKGTEFNSLTPKFFERKKKYFIFHLGK
ncbi:hypothetical protein CD798_03250 [Bacillaceae bacterium SAOS 7]|nr:hypothetical protein CD798_03250 [Bacillaceae bacterium SAOS 7]